MAVFAVLNDPGFPVISISIVMIPRAGAPRATCSEVQHGAHSAPAYVSFLNDIPVATIVARAISAPITIEIA